MFPVITHKHYWNTYPETSNYLQDIIGELIGIAIWTIGDSFAWYDELINTALLILL